MPAAPCSRDAVLTDEFRVPPELVQPLRHSMRMLPPQASASSLLDAEDRKAVGLGTKRKRRVMGRHDQLGVREVLPQERSGEVDGVEGPEFSRHRLGRSIEDDRIDLHELERGDQPEDRGSACRYFGVGESRPETQSIQRTETLGHDEGTSNALVDLPPLRQRVRLAKRNPQQD